jgi:hypothetical protein
MRTTRILAAAALTVSAALIATPSASAQPDGISSVRAATAGFHEVSAAVAAGWSLELHDVNGIACIDNPAGAMGIHYVNGGLVGDGAIDALTPEAVIYAPQADGSLRLVAVEYVVIKAQWDESHASPPALFGQPFTLVPAGNRYDLPDFYELHAWIWRNNPAGMFEDWNPKVVCP